MSRQVIAQEWKIIETLFDIGTNDFYTKTRRIGNYTKATALKKAGQIFHNYTWKNVPSHGSGGYWVNASGVAAELVPSF